MSETTSSATFASLMEALQPYKGRRLHVRVGDRASGDWTIAEFEGVLEEFASGEEPGVETMTLATGDGAKSWSISSISFCTPMRIGVGRC